MQLYLVRHGDAVEPHVESERPLSEVGIAEVEALGSHLAASGVKTASIWHSEYLRAQQTAQRLGAHLKCEDIRHQANLAPGDSIAPIAEIVRQLEDNLMLVGHLPYMGLLASELLARDANRMDVIFNTATAMCIRVDGRSACLNWMISPALLPTHVG